jgi:hypothetical protein
MTDWCRPQLEHWPKYYGCDSSIYFRAEAAHPALNGSQNLTQVWSNGVSNIIGSDKQDLPERKGTLPSRLPVL